MMSTSSNRPHSNGWTFERLLHATARFILPHAMIKHITPLYYGLNKYRFRLMPRPYIPQVSTTCYARRVREGFFEKYCHGQGIDIGYGGDPVTPTVRGWDIEDGDAHEMPGVAAASYDFVYSSSSLEHMDDPVKAVTRWWEILRPGGYLIISVPDRDLFEKKKTLPSRFSLDHKHFFLLHDDDPPDTMGLVALVKRTCPGAEIIEARQHTEGHTVTDPYKQADGEFFDEVIARKPGPI
jgi:SAM-dependent methyltransferase